MAIMSFRNFPHWLKLVVVLTVPVGTASLAWTKPATRAPQLTCDASITKNFKPNSQTKVLLVRAYKKGDKLPNATVQDRVGLVADEAMADSCMVKLLVGPGNPGPADAPSSSRGVGIEIWLPAKGAWNGRMQAVGGGGWAGNEAADVTKVAVVAASNDIQTPPGLVADGSVVSSTDTGHDMRRAPGGTFAMNPDGSINTVLWTDFASRAIHLQVMLTKALTTAYYGSAPKYSYWNGVSTGGRQGLKQAQRYPRDFDGIIAGSPAVNWTRFFTGQLYPYLVMERDLGGNYMSLDQLNLVSKTAISACDLVGGKHAGYILDAERCRYDPTKDKNVLCIAEGGKNNTPACLDRRQALAINKVWYGMTSDGSVPDPAVDNGFGPLSGKHKWYGIPRGTNLRYLASSATMSLWADQVALEMQDGRVATPMFRNAMANGADGWKSLSYGQLSKAFDAGVALQPQFGDINTDDADLTAFRARGGKVLMYHGTSDELILYQGTVRYYESVLAKMGGIAKVRPFFRFYEILGAGHEPFNGTANPDANPPLVRPGKSEFYKLLTDWVEKGIAPDNFVLRSSTDKPLAKSLPMCSYPTRVTYVSGDLADAKSYTCR
jgi:hypothetical protein